MYLTTINSFKYKTYVNIKIKFKVISWFKITVKGKTEFNRYKKDR